MSVKIKRKIKVPERRTWLVIFKDAWKCKTPTEARQWLEKEALILKRRMPGYTLAGAKYIIRMNLGALAMKYGEFTVRRIKKLFGVVSPLFGPEVKFERERNISDDL